MNLTKYLLSTTLLSIGIVPLSKAQNFTYSDIKLQHVQFVGDTLAIKKDGLSTFYTGYHWSSAAGAAKKPAAYVSNKAPRVTAKFTWSCPSVPDSVYIKGLANDGMLFPALKLPITAVGSENVITYPATNSTTVFGAGKAKYFDTFAIDWQISYDGLEYMHIGKSETELFVVKNNPMTETSDFKYWHTVYYLSCKNADGLSTESEIIAALFTEFEDQQVLNHKGDTLRYYRHMATSNVSLAKLLEMKDAQCFTYAKLFLAMIKIQGIVRTNNYVNITPMGTACGNAINRFVVKDWEAIATPTSTCTNFPYENRYISLFNTSYTSYNFYYTEIEDQDGIPGPGNTNPSSYFNNHQIAIIDGKYYDACYGVKYNSLAEYTTNSIEGWSYRYSAYDASVGATANYCHFTTNLALSSFTQSITTY